MFTALLFQPHMVSIPVWSVGEMCDTKEDEGVHMEISGQAQFTLAKLWSHQQLPAFSCSGFLMGCKLLISWTRHLLKDSSQANLLKQECNHSGLFTLEVGSLTPGWVKNTNIVNNTNKICASLWFVKAIITFKVYYIGFLLLPGTVEWMMFVIICSDSGNQSVQDRNEEWRLRALCCNIWTWFFLSRVPFPFLYELHRQNTFPNKKIAFVHISNWY